MFSAEHYLQGPSQFTQSSPSSPLCLYVDASQFCNPTGRLAMLSDPLATTNAPPALDVGNQQSYHFPTCVYGAGPAAVAGTVTFLVRGLPPTVDGTVFDLDLTYLRLTGANPVAFNVDLYIGQSQYRGHVVLAPSDTQRLESTRVVWNVGSAQATFIPRWMACQGHPRLLGPAQQRHATRVAAGRPVPDVPGGQCRPGVHLLTAPGRAVSAFPAKSFFFCDPPR